MEAACSRTSKAQPGSFSSEVLVFCRCPQPPFSAARRKEVCAHVDEETSQEVSPLRACCLCSTLLSQEGEMPRVVLEMSMWILFRLKGNSVEAFIMMNLKNLL